MPFIHADKRRYTDYFNAVLPLIKTGGFIIADNTLWDGHVVETCRHSAHTQGIIDFNNLAASSPCVEAAIIPLRDGLTILRKTGIPRNPQPNCL